MITPKMKYARCVEFTAQWESLDLDKDQGQKQNILVWPDLQPRCLAMDVGAGRDGEFQKQNKSSSESTESSH